MDLKDSIVVADTKATKRSFFGFDVFITPLLLKIFFVLALIACVVSGLVEIARGLKAGELNHLPLCPHLIQGSMLLVFCPIMLRVFCEFVIIQFKLFEMLRDKR